MGGPQRPVGQTLARGGGIGQSSGHFHALEFPTTACKDKPGKECQRAVKSTTNQLFGAPDPPRADGSNGSPRQSQWALPFLRCLGNGWALGRRLRLTELLCVHFVQVVLLGGTPKVAQDA